MEANSSLPKTADSPDPSGTIATNAAMLSLITEVRNGINQIKERIVKLGSDVMQLDVKVVNVDGNLTAISRSHSTEMQKLAESVTALDSIVRELRETNQGHKAELSEHVNKLSENLQKMSEDLLKMEAIDMATILALTTVRLRTSSPPILVTNIQRRHSTILQRFSHEA